MKALNIAIASFLCPLIVAVCWFGFHYRLGAAGLLIFLLGIFIGLFGFIPRQTNRSLPIAGILLNCALLAFSFLFGSWFLWYD
jgi:hypothetical protein